MRTFLLPSGGFDNVFRYEYSKLIKEIACVLAGKASEDMIKKVEKSLKKVSIRRIRRKRAVTRKV
jgi:hypothetical protein